jgi:hypothetical protein
MTWRRVSIDRNTVENLEILARLWGHRDLPAIVASCVRRIVLEEIERARHRSNPPACACRDIQNDAHF